MIPAWHRYQLPAPSQPSSKMAPHDALPSHAACAAASEAYAVGDALLLLHCLRGTFGQALSRRPPRRSPPCSSDCRAPPSGACARLPAERKTGAQRVRARALQARADGIWGASYFWSRNF